MSEDWRIGYKRALLAAWARKCGVECKDPSQYGWEDYTGSEAMCKHLASCGIDPVKTPLPEVAAWDHFMGTFTGCERVQGARLRVTCRCGQYRKVRTRLESPLSDLILAVVKED